MYDHSVDELAAYVLAGGKSTRMGADKAFLELGGTTLLARALDLARSVAHGACIVGDPQKFGAFAPAVEDVFHDQGPLAGIHAALQASSAELNLVLAVDLPFVEAKFLKYLAAQARATPAVVTVPRAAGGWQPLCAVYRRSFAEVAERSLRAGRNKIDRLFAEVETRALEETDLSRLGFSAEMFRNLNTREELARAQHSHGNHRGHGA